MADDQRKVMPKESGYFEESSELHHDPDLFISNITEILYRIMLACYLERGLTPLPRGDFNIFYFYQSVVRVLLIQHPEVTLTSKGFPYPCARINAVNWPDSSRIWSLQHNSATLISYLNLVSGDSEPSGDNFDLGYAVEILTRLLKNETYINMSIYFKAHLPGSSKRVGDVDFDEWLAGFIDKQSGE
jgi:hypothetical protein